MRVYGGGAYPAYIVDPDTLREELLSEEDTLEWLEETPLDPHAPSFWRMLGQLDTALSSGEARLAEQEPASPAWAAAALRLAQVHHRRGELDVAHELFDAVELLCGHDQPVLVGLLEVRARSLFDEGALEQARTDAARAVVLRQADGGGSLAASQEILARVERSLMTGEGNGPGG